MERRADACPVVVSTVYSFFTLETDTLLTIRKLQQASIVYFAIFSASPIPIVLAARFVPGAEKRRFGRLGSMNDKVIIVAVAAVALSTFRAPWLSGALLTDIATENIFRAVVAFMPMRSIRNLRSA